MSGLSEVNSMVSTLQSSLDSALSKLTANASTTKSKDVESYRQDVTKSSLNAPATATNLGSLVKDKSRLNVVSTLGKLDPVDFYKFTVTSAGTVALGQVGDSSIRFQLLDKTGNIVADSASGQGSASDNYAQMKAGTLSLDTGSYTVRISRNKDASLINSADYAFQLQMGTFTEDYDTVAKEPTQSTSSSLLSILNGGTTSSGSNLIALLTGNTSSSSSGPDLVSLLTGNSGSSSDSSSTDLSSLLSSAGRGTLLNQVL